MMRMSDPIVRVFNMSSDMMDLPFQATWMSFFVELSTAASEYALSPNTKLVINTFYNGEQMVVTSDMTLEDLDHIDALVNYLIREMVKNIQMEARETEHWFNINDFLRI